MSETMMRIFRQALAVSVKGMLVLFTFMFLFFVLLIVIDKVFPGKDIENSN